MSEKGFTVNDFSHLEEAQTESSGQWGIYDTRDNCWLGDDHGPRLFTHEDSKKVNGMPVRIMAQIAAQMLEVQLGYSKDGQAGRLRAQEYQGQELVHRDSVDTIMTPVEALTLAEGGKLED